MKLMYDGVEVPAGGYAGGSNSVYSTEEVRIGTYVNGEIRKPLYRRVIEQSSITGSATGSTKIGDTDTWGIDQVISMNGVFYDVVSLNSGSNDSADGINHFYGSNAYGMTWMTVDKSVYARNVGRTTSSIRLILEYTKTTDSPSAPVVETSTLVSGEFSTSMFERPIITATTSGEEFTIEGGTYDKN